MGFALTAAPAVALVADDPYRVERPRGALAHSMIENSWGIAALWMGLALLASFISVRFKLSVALVEILVGIAAGNLAMLLDQHHVFGMRWNLESTEWVGFLAGFGSVLLTFLAGAEIEPSILRLYFKESLAIGAVSFAVTFAAASRTPITSAVGTGTRR